MIQKKEKYTRNIAQKTVGQLGQKLLKSVLIVVKKLLLVSQLIKSIAIKSVGMNTTEKDSKDIILRSGRVEKQKEINVLGHLQLLENGVRKCLREIITPVRFVVGEVKVVIELKYTQTILSDWQIIQNSLLMWIMGELYVQSVIEKQTLGGITDPRYIDVIRKRYANFIGKGEEWQKITPKI